MNYFKYYYILIIFFTFISCELEVEIDIPIPDPKLSASCFFTDNGEWYVHVSKSKFILDTVGFDLIADANVEIYENNNLIETLEHIGNGWYSTIGPIGSIALVGATYQLIVTSQDAMPIRATETFPEKPKIETITFDNEQEYNLIGFENNIGYKLEISFGPTNNQNNYYYLNIMNNSSLNDSSSNDNYVHYHEFNDMDDRKCHIGGMFFTQSEYNNDENTLVLFIDSGSLKNSSQLLIELNCITSNFYDYANTLDNNYLMSSSLDIDGIRNGVMQPVYIKSNIENGYGIFVGINGETTILELN